MIRQTEKRPGVTLMEVLIAIGILAVGMLAIMALFPIGAVSMARAINQNRAADHAANSDAMFRYYWKKAWIDPNGGSVRSSAYEAYGYSLNTYPATGEEMIPLLDRKQPIVPTNVINNAPPPDISPSSTQPSYPVLIDPIGHHTQVSIALANQLYVAGSGNLPARSTLAAAETMPFLSVIRTTTMLDDMSWDINGEPANNTGQLDRGGRYNCAWLIQRPKNNVPHEVHLYVLVYGGRSPTDTPSAETTFTGTVYNYIDGVDPKPNSVTIAANAQSTPNVRRGGWVAFSVLIRPTALGNVPTVPYPAFDFYRIAAVTDDISTNGTMTLEFEQPLRTYSTTSFGGQYNGGTLTGTLVVLDNLLEVFDRGMVSAQAISGR